MSVTRTSDRWGQSGTGVGSEYRPDRPRTDDARLIAGAHDGFSPADWPRSVRHRAKRGATPRIVVRVVVPDDADVEASGATITELCKHNHHQIVPRRWTAKVHDSVGVASDTAWDRRRHDRAPLGDPGFGQPCPRSSAQPGEAGRTRSGRAAKRHTGRRPYRFLALDGS